MPPLPPKKPVWVYVTGSVRVGGWIRRSPVGIRIRAGYVHDNAKTSMPANGEKSADTMMAIVVIMDFLGFCDNKWIKQLTAEWICCAKSAL